MRHNDLFTLAESRIHERLIAAQAGVYIDMLYALYGDSAYPIMECILSRHTQADGHLNALEILENNCMAAARETVEWVNADCYL